jgi:DNA-directed RNA polymerase specialized sigma24 family protein
MTGPTPWWVNDPVLLEIRRRTAEEFGIDLEAAESTEPEGPDDSDDSDDLDSLDYPDEPTRPDPVMLELENGRCWRELAEARDALAQARDRYDAAVRTARIAGFSWGEIGNVLGVAKQQLHRRFGTRQRGRP